MVRAQTVEPGWSRRMKLSEPIFFTVLPALQLSSSSGSVDPLLYNIDVDINHHHHESSFSSSLRALAGRRDKAGRVFADPLHTSIFH